MAGQVTVKGAHISIYKDVASATNGKLKFHFAIPMATMSSAMMEDIHPSN